MPSPTSLLALLPLLALTIASNPNTYPHYEYGNNFYLGPIPNNYITKSTYTLSVPPPPSDYTDKSTIWLALWIGLQDDPTGANVLKEQFVQPLVNWAPDNEKYGCAADVEHWCGAASTYTPGGQKEQPLVPIPSNAQLDFEVSIDDSGSIFQSISMGGDVISKQTGSSGMKPAVFYSGSECYDNGCGTLASHSWSNITLHLSQPSTSLDQYLRLEGAKSSGMQTADNGKTWTIQSIEIEKQDLTSGSGSSSTGSSGGLLSGLTGSSGSSGSSSESSSSGSGSSGGSSGSGSMFGGSSSGSSAPSWGGLGNLSGSSSGGSSSSDGSSLGGFSATQPSWGQGGSSGASGSTGPSWPSFWRS